jgi:mono/diheme cytochrome c family protein/glucose/arabinose dehydrogenase
MFRRLVACPRRTVRRLATRSLAVFQTATSFLVILTCSLLGCSPGESSDQEGPSPEQTPRQELTSFQIEQGLAIQLVAAEPLVEDPVVFSFDADGRLWVVEMRGYMPNLDGEGEREPVGRVSVLEDRDDDGVMDVSTVYLDSLILPRALALVGGGVLVVSGEALWLTKDVDGDLRADSKTLIDADYAGSGLPEHSGNGLWRGIDNWYYNAKSRFRYRFVDGRFIRDSTEFRGQWGISHDDAGRLFYNYNWSQLHADLVPPNYLTRNKNHTPVSGIDHGLTIDRRVFPIRPTPAVNRGYIPGILNDEKKLQEFTAACSPFVYRGQALPADFYGNVFVCEPSGNLIKRNIIKSEGLYLSAYDPHSGKEFLASTDERFRPVHLATGPDGALYVADMYRGLIQHKAYVTPYLREQTLSRKLTEPIHRGRIWRIVPQGWRQPRKTRLSTLTSAEMIRYLSHPDGWYRDIAQRLLVERQDTTLRQPLSHLALKGQNVPGRFHALWTLQGLSLLDTELLFELLGDPHPLIKTTALRLLEPFAEADKNVRTRLGSLLLKEWRHAPIQHVLQIAFTAELLEPKVSRQLLGGIATRYDTSALIRDAILSSISNEELDFMQTLLASGEWKTQTPSREIFLEMLTSCVVRKRSAAELKTLLSLIQVDRSTFGWQQKAILTGMSIQGMSGKVRPIKLSAAPGILARKDLDVPLQHLQGLASLFEWPGSPVRGDSIMQQGHVLDEQAKQQFALGRKYYLSTCSGCHGNDGGGLNRFGPPLKGSEWVLGDEKRLSLILLHGIEGALVVGNKRYDQPEILPVMPGHSTLDDGTIAAILTYIRNEWGNQASAVTRKSVGTTRLTNQGRVLPWTAEELNAHMKKSYP